MTQAAILEHWFAFVADSALGGRLLRKVDGYGNVRGYMINEDGLNYLADLVRRGAATNLDVRGGAFPTMQVNESGTSDKGLRGAVGDGGAVPMTF